jgi:hypothetical protein
MPRFTDLDPAAVRVTIARLAARIEERFPGSGLAEVATELLRLSDQTAGNVERLRRPVWWLRALTALAIACVVALAGWVGYQLLHSASGGLGFADLVQSIEAGLNELIFLGLTIFFLVSLEVRLKRRMALAMLHHLRSIAHVVDMHQLTKDPEQALRPLPPTPSSPARSLSRAELTRYLDYCSELLALTSKLAALHAQGLHDPVVLDAVNDIETLSSDLSRKIWQKITILDIALAPWSAAPGQGSVASTASNTSA